MPARGRPPLTARVTGVTAQEETPILEVGGHLGVFFLTRTATGWQVARDGSPPLAGYEARATDVERVRRAFLATLAPPQETGVGTLPP